MAHIASPLIVAISLALMLMRPRGIAEAWWVSGGVLLLLVLRLMPLEGAGQAVAEGRDVYFFLIGMMLLSELAREHGVFDWMAFKAVHHARGSCSRLFILVYGLGSFVTIFLSNDATAVILTPAILAAVRKARVSPMPYLFVCALIANAASFMLPISNPANLVVFHAGLPPLRAWLIEFAVPCLLSIVATFLVTRFVFRRELQQSIDAAGEETHLKASGKLVLVGLVVVVAILLTASAEKRDLGLPTCLAAVALTAVVSIGSRKSPAKLARAISWPTLLLVAGLFVLVHAVEDQGALQVTRHWLAWAATLDPRAGAMVVGLGVGLLTDLVNNLPLGLIAGGTLQSSHPDDLLTHAVLIGIDLGPNLSVTGSLATILWLLELRKDSGSHGEKLNVSFWRFLTIGSAAMPAALIAALAGAILVQGLIGQH